MQRCPGCQYLVPEAWDECKKCGAPLRSEAVAATRTTAPLPANRAAAAAPPPQYRTSLPETTRRRRRAPLIVGVVAVVAVSLAVGTLVLRADKAERVPANVSAYARGGAGTEYRDAANVFVATLPVTPIELPQHITVSQHDITVHVASAAATQRWSVVIGWLDLPGEFTRGGFIGTIPGPVVDALATAITAGGRVTNTQPAPPPDRGVAAEDVTVELTHGADAKARVVLTSEHRLVFAGVVSRYSAAPGFDRLVKSLRLAR